MMQPDHTKRHPYIGLPDRQFWKNEPGIAKPHFFDPVSNVPFQISKADRVVTAGSCFAQHVARNLNASGFNHLITETAHPMFPRALAETFNYGLFSARYGNVYTARQFLQLLHRAFDQFDPIVRSWPKAGSDRVVDPFRPQIQPDGFVSEAELLTDQVQHFAAIRRAVLGMEVLVFTLGLTECWEDTRDGSIFPLAPGVAGGIYDPPLVRFRNFDEVETSADLIAALEFIRSHNPAVRIILTVSPVPLNATMEDRHVFESTTWSKAVLRIAAEKAVKALSDIVYFPSYEIITSPHVRGRYFAADCREVLPEGVGHVMRLFFKHFAGIENPLTGPRPVMDRTDDHIAEMEHALAVQCDEEAIDNR
jgi:hypothetical protein